MKDMRSTIIILTVLGFVFVALSGIASANTANMTSSNMAIIFENGKPVSQIVGFTTGPYNGTGYSFFDMSYKPHTTGSALKGWVYTHPYVNVTYDMFYDDMLTNTYMYSLNLTN